MRNENNIIEKKDIDTLYEYLINIKKFEETLNKTDVYIIIKKDFYIINLLDYNIFKEQIKYESLVKYITNEKVCKEEINQYLKENKIIMEKIEKIKLIDTTKLDLGNIYSEQYKIINDILATVICDLEQNDINNKLCFTLDYPKFHIEEKKIDLLYYDYIIDKSLIFTQDNKEILYTSKAIVEYYKLYNYFKLNRKKDKKEKYYLTKTENTNNILSFISNHSEFDFNKENIIYGLIEYITNNRDSDEIKNLFKFEILNFKTKDEFIKYNENKKKDISIINEYIYFLIKDNKENIAKKDLSYYCYQELDGVIHIEFKDKTVLQFTPYDNILKFNNRIHSENFLKKTYKLLKNLVKKGCKKIKCLFGYSKEKKEEKENNLIIEEDKINNYNDIEIKSGEYAFTLIEKDENETEQEEKIDINDNQNDFEVIKIEKKREIKSLFKECPGIGLQNIGATCYMNATLQCFAHIEKFINFFKYNSQVNKSKNINDIIKSGENKTNSLFPSFKILIEKLWPDNYQTLEKKYYAPNDFKNKISEMNPLFQGIAANDSKDLVNFIIMTLHEELNRVKNKNIIIDTPLIDQTNQQLVLKNFLEDFANKNQSIISDLFYALNYTITECTICHMKLYNYQIYFFIIFPLEEVRKFKLDNQFNFNNGYNNFYNNNMIMNNFNNFNNNNFLLNNKTVNIYDCFDYDKKINYMGGSNAMYCNNCKVNRDCTMQTFLAAGPEILILLLNRGKGKEFDVKIDFYEEINLFNYIEYNGTGYKYKLIGVISHIGESGMGGHFIAYCRDPIKNEWNKFNDAIVTKVVDFQNEVINFAMPYLLFYQKEL